MIEGVEAGKMTSDLCYAFVCFCLHPHSGVSRRVGQRIAELAGRARRQAREKALSESKRGVDREALQVSQKAMPQQSPESGSMNLLSHKIHPSDWSSRRTNVGDIEQWARALHEALHSATSPEEIYFLLQPLSWEPEALEKLKTAYAQDSLQAIERALKDHPWQSEAQRDYALDLLHCGKTGREQHVLALPSEEYQVLYAARCIKEALQGKYVEVIYATLTSFQGNRLLLAQLHHHYNERFASKNLLADLRAQLSETSLTYALYLLKEESTTTENICEQKERTLLEVHRNTHS